MTQASAEAELEKRKKQYATAVQKFTTMLRKTKVPKPKQNIVNEQL